MDYKPLFDKVIVRPVSNEHRVGGLIIPDTSTNMKKGIVVSVGPKAVQVREGNEVLYSKGVGTFVTIEGEQYLVLDERDIWISN